MSSKVTTPPTLPAADDANEVASRERKAQWQRTRRRFLSERGFTVGGAVFLVLLVTAFVGPLLMPYDPLSVEPADRLQGPSAAHWLGTDTFGRDVFSRILTGGQVSIAVGTGVAILSGLTGVILGLYAAFYKTADMILMRICDGLMAFPAMLLAIAITAVMGPSMNSLILGLSIVFMPIVARVARSAALTVKSQTYIEALVAQGARSTRILWLDVLPNALSPVIVQVTFIFADALLVEAALSFMGLGVPAPEPSWGNMLLEGKSVIYTSWWLIAFPGLAILLMVLSVNLMGDSMRDLLDPNQKSIRGLFAKRSPRVRKAGRAS
jgi:peptide/nickel transport system permease protein